MKKNIAPLFILLVSALGLGTNAASQITVKSAEQQVLDKDSVFWVSYNNCDTTNYARFFSSDVEFYHDKGGITSGIDGLANSIKKNLCSNPDFRIKREAVQGTVLFFPLARSGEIYGAVLSGDHLFYIIEKGNPPRLDGRAKFTHLWQLKNGEWKMTRIISYDHGAPR